jgi:hypothetical protein
LRSEEILFLRSEHGIYQTYMLALYLYALEKISGTYNYSTSPVTFAWAVMKGLAALWTAGLSYAETGVLL